MATNKKVWYSYRELEAEYTFGKGFSISFYESQSFTEESKFYIIVYKLSGTYPNFEREPKYKGFIKEEIKRFLANEDRTKYKEVPLS